MSPVFSAASPLFHEERGIHHLELQLVLDEELMDIWEQTQRAVFALEEKGWDPPGAMHYCDALVWEMQRRLARLPVGWRFGVSKKHEQDKPDLPHAAPKIVTVHLA